MLLVGAGLHSLGSLLLLGLLVHDNVTEPWVLESFCCANAQLGAELKHSLKEIDAGVVDGVKDAAEILGGVHLESGFVLGELCDAWPSTLSWRSHDAENANDLILVCGSGEERSAGVHLCHNAACGPDVDAGIVGPAA